MKDHEHEAANRGPSSGQTAGGAHGGASGGAPGSASGGAPAGAAAGADSADAGCAVDWSWLAGRSVASAASDLTSFRLTFADGQTLRIRALLYKGKPFLSFEPHEAPKG